MDLLIITENKNATSDEVFHPLIDTAKLLGEKAYLYPMRTTLGIYHEFQIGRFEVDSSDLVVHIPMPGSPDEMKLVVSGNSNYYEPSTNQKFDVIRLALVTCDNDELLFRFCKTYLNLRHDHQISYEVRHDKLLNFENIAKVKYVPYWYEMIDKW